MARAMFFSCWSPKSQKSKIKFAGSILLHARRDADAAWLGQAFEAGRDVDPVTEDVTVLDDHVALMDADP